MIYSILLFTHITVGVASFIFAPLYLVLAGRGAKYAHISKIGAWVSAISTAALGIALLFAGAPLGRSCVTLTAYMIVMVGLIKLGDIRAKKAIKVYIQSGN